MGLASKILLFVFVSHLFVLPEYVRELMVLNLGWGNIYPLRLYTVGLPALYVLHQCRKRGELRTPHLYAFTVLLVTFAFFESLPHREGPSGFSLVDMIPFSGALFPGREATYSFAVEQLNIYVFFLILVNFGMGRSFFYRVVDYSLCAGLMTCAITYAGYAGIINLGAEYLLQEAGLVERPSTLVNANQISYAGAFSMLLLIIKQLNEKRFSLPHVARDFFLLSMFTLLVVVNATRGAFAVALLMLAYYCLMLWRYSASARKYIVSFTSALVVLAALHWGSGVPGVLEKTNIYQRFFVLPAESTGVEERAASIENSIENFKRSPLFGVGYHNAAKSVYGEGTRTNNQFLQMLATGGIFYFLIYMFYNYRLLVCRARLLARPEVALSVIFHLIYLQLSRAVSLAFLSLSAYMAVYFYYSGLRHEPAAERTADSPEVASAGP